mmetsp:Transcript_27990/g.73403  ORF Transcript_27990/g.73403 Transcript_27990/m.73403 type:complete len:260 (+) Transcript_27990:814-1593(+)
MQRSRPLPPPPPLRGLAPSMRPSLQNGLGTRRAAVPARLRPSLRCRRSTSITAAATVSAAARRRERGERSMVAKAVGGAATRPTHRPRQPRFQQPPQPPPLVATMPRRRGGTKSWPCIHTPRRKRVTCSLRKAMFSMCSPMTSPTGGRHSGRTARLASFRPTTWLNRGYPPSRGFTERWAAPRLQRSCGWLRFRERFWCARASQKRGSTPCRLASRAPSSITTSRSRTRNSSSMTGTAFHRLWNWWNTTSTIRAGSSLG